MGRMKKKFDIATVRLLLIQKGRCFYCGEKMPLDRQPRALEITKDHFHPKSKNNTLTDNMVLCHQKCNVFKAAQEPTKQQYKMFSELKYKVNLFNKEIKRTKLLYRVGEI